MFNSHYIDIAEKISGKKSSHFTCDKNISDTVDSGEYCLFVPYATFRSIPLPTSQNGIVIK